MDFIRRAWLFTKAKISRTILLIVAFTAILVFVFSGLIINSAANKSIENAKTAAGATVSLSVNMQNVVKQAQSTSSSSSTDSSSSSDEGEQNGRFNITMPTIEESTAQEISELDNVSSYNFSYSASADASSGITKVSESTTTSSNAEGSNGGMFGGGGGPGGQSQGDFTIQGTNDLSTDSSFSSSYELISGRAIEASDEGTNNVVIESTLAEQNDLKVGSTFVLTDSNSQTYTMTIVGIFTTTSSSTQQSIAYMNTMYTALSVPNAIKQTTGQISTASYSMSNPAKSSTFVKAANKLVDDDTFQVSADTAAYENVKTSLGNVASFAKNIVILVAIAGAIILALIVMLMVRERRFEIGVLMSLGEAKAKIVGQFFVELFMVMIVSVGIATAAGNVVGNVVGQQLLKQETTSAQTTGMQRPGGNGNAAGNGTGQSMGNPPANGGGFMGGAGRAFGFGQSSAQIKALEKLDIKTSPSKVALLVGIAILITLVAVGLASIGILRLNPKQVLTS
ncbi:MAG: ABC transporter permease [Streptococcaceae bacterium]|jgi:putative ABC transport system permease protein|nr:ABC transporter permease [Streptococcaceae bacterium]